MTRCKSLGIKIRFPTSNQTFVDKQIIINDAFRGGDITSKENGNAGNDHGHGSAVWLMGVRLNGGKIYGNWTGLAESALYKKRDLPVTTDFRAVFSDVLQGHLKMEVQKGFFPDYRQPKKELGLFA